MGSATGEPWKDRSEHAPGAAQCYGERGSAKKQAEKVYKKTSETVWSSVKIVRFKQDTTEEALVAVRVRTC